MDIKETIGELIEATTKEGGVTGNGEDIHSTAGNAKTAWVKYIMVALVLEEIIQHIMVTTAFYFNWNAIASTVAVSPSLLMILGADVAVCFILSLWGLITQQKWATTLLIAPAVFDRVEEFVAQGRLSIVVTVSFIVATSLLALTLSYRRQELRRAM